MFSIIRSFTSLYWVIRDIFRPLFRTTFFWLVLLALGVWLVLSGRAGAIDLNDLTSNQSSYNPGTYPTIVPGTTASIPAGAEYVTNLGSSRHPVFLKTNVGWREIFFPFMSLDGSNAGNFKIANNSGIFSISYGSYVANFGSVYDGQVSFVFGDNTDRFTKDTIVGSLVGNILLTGQVVYKVDLGRYNSYGSNTRIAIMDFYRREIIYYNVDSSFYNLFTNYNLLNILQNKTPEIVFTNVDMFYFGNNLFESPCSSFFSEFPVTAWQSGPTLICSSGSPSSYNPSSPIDLESYLNVVLSEIDSSGTGSYENLITEQDFKNYNMSMCIEKNLSMVNDFDLRANLTACKIGSDSNVASGGTDIFMSMIAFYDQIANGSYTTSFIPWDTFDVYDSNVIQNCQDVHTSRKSLMLATRDPNIKPRNDQMLSAYNILDQMRPLYNTNSTISHDYEKARSSCELSLNIIYKLQKTEIKDSCTGIGCIVENIMKQETPIVNSWLNPVGTWIAGIIAKIENIFTAITGTNTALDGVKNAINEKNMSFTGYTDIINNITGITVDIPDVVVDIPDVVVDIPDINIDLGSSQGTSTGGIFSFLNEYTTISTEYVFVPNMCKNTTPTNYDNRNNLIMLFMVTITTISFYFVITRR